jgi:hypothetical protein
MKKRKSTRETENMIQTALWLPRDMHERLKNAGGERGLGDEIRRRVALSFAVEQKPRDADTDLLLRLIGWVAQNLGADEPWAATEFARDTFQEAIKSLILELYSHLGGGGESKLQARYGRDSKPQTIGPVIGHAAFVANAQEALRQEFSQNKKV